MHDRLFALKFSLFESVVYCTSNITMFLNYDHLSVESKISQARSYKKVIFSVTNVGKILLRIKRDGCTGGGS